MSQATNSALSNPTIILVVEDDTMILEDVAAILTEAGFSPLTASSAEAALKHVGGEASIRTLLTDIDLSGSVSGWDIARTTREAHPNIPVIYMTGGNADEWTAHGVPGSILIRKPFVPAQIITAISQLLNAAESG